MPGMRGDLAEWVGYLKDIGVTDLRVVRPNRSRKAAPAVVATDAGPAVKPSKRSESATRRLEEVRKELGDCKRCKLHSGRTKLVFGVGNPDAQLMFVGEGPGQNEDLQGEPFVGRAGKKLDEMIVAIGLSREQVYIANIVKCRPPGNRDPERDEIETCSPFLHAQIKAIAPRVIVTLGGPATKTLLQTTVGITRLRGTWNEYHGIPVMPTFHPAYVLRNYTKQTRQQVWKDLKAARARTEES
jgi:uracil-DNA glycosylase family 4